jgi:hypothetical protein
MLTIVSVLLSIGISWGIITSKLSRFEEIAGVVASNQTKIAKRDEEMLEVHRRLDKIDEIKIDVRLAEIQRDLKYITAILEDKR